MISGKIDADCMQLPNESQLARMPPSPLMTFEEEASPAGIKCHGAVCVGKVKHREIGRPDAHRGFSATSWREELGGRGMLSVAQS